MKVTPLDGPRLLSDPPCKAAPGDEVEVTDKVGASLVAQGTWKQITKKPDKPVEPAIAEKEKD